MSTKPLKTDEKDSKAADDSTVKAAPLSEAIETVNVRILRTHPDLAYANGEEVEMPTALYDKYKGDENSGPFIEKI